MATDAANVEVAVTGAVLHAPLGTALPVDAATAPNVAFVDVGYLSTDGITQSKAVSQQVIQAWQNGDTVRTVITQDTLEFKFKMIEGNANALGAYYGGDYVAGTVEVTGRQGMQGEWIFEIYDGAKHTRIVVPNAQITGWDDVVYKLSQEIQYGVTLTAYPDVAGVKAYIYTA